MAETRAMLAELPDPDKLVGFDRSGKVMVTMTENIERATRPQLAELVRLLVEQVERLAHVIEGGVSQVAIRGR